MKSKLFALDRNDLFKGLVVAIVAAVLTTILQWVNAPGFDFYSFDWSELARISISSGVAYLIKNLMSDSQGNVLGKEVPQKDDQTGAGGGLA